MGLLSPRVMNFTYGMGAAVVIVGALFKIQHWTGASAMLIIGLSTEALIFGLSAFDKPEKDNNSRKVPYPAKAVSLSTFGHTGFTGTCTWADPEKGIVFVLLANRVHPIASNKFLELNVRGKIMEEIFTAY